MNGEEEWPEVGDLVVVTVTSITPYGVYVSLGEYGGRQGFLHISEISTIWVKHIRDHVREGRKAILKVLRVDERRRHIDLSLKRVSDGERSEKLFIWKRIQKGGSLLNSVAKRLEISENEAYERIGAPLEEEFNGLYEAFEAVNEKGETALAKIALPPEAVQIICRIAKEKVKVAKVKVKGIFELASWRPDGVDAIRETLTELKSKRGSGVDVDIYIVGAPRYRVEVTAKDYKTAERFLEKLAEKAEREMNVREGTFSFKKGEKS